MQEEENINNIQMMRVQMRSITLLVQVHLLISQLSNYEQMIEIVKP